MINTLKISHSPDPDDAFAWWGITSGHFSIGDFTLEINHLSMQQANEACLAGELDVAAISSAAWPFFSDQYHILSTGASVGRGYGPALAAKQGVTFKDLRKGVVALPGRLTTGALLFKLFYPEVQTIEMPCHLIAESILNGEVTAGVLIHEDLLNYTPLGLQKLSCLGSEWLQLTGLPIPVGLIAVKKSLGDRTVQEVSNALLNSIEMALQSPEKAMSAAMNLSHEKSSGIGSEFIEMFTNSDSIHLPNDCIKALRLLYAQAFSRELIPTLPTVNPISPSRSQQRIIA